MNSADRQYLAKMGIIVQDAAVDASMTAKLEEFDPQFRKLQRRRRPPVREALVQCKRNRESVKEALALIAGYLLNSGAESVTVRIQS